MNGFQMPEIDLKKMIGIDYTGEIAGITNSVGYDVNVLQQSNPIISLQTPEFYQTQPGAERIIASRPRSFYHNQPEVDEALISDLNNCITLKRSKRGKYSPFMNAVILKAERFDYDAYYDKVSGVKFYLRSHHLSAKEVYLTEDQLKKPDDVIRQFQLQAGVYFISNHTDSRCGELLLRMLMSMLNHADTIVQQKYSNPIIEMKNRLDNMTNHCEKSSLDAPVTAAELVDFFTNLMVFKESALRCISLSFLITPMLKPLMKNLLIQDNIIVVEGSIKRYFEVLKSFLMNYPGSTPPIASLDGSREVESALLNGKNECIMLCDFTMNRSVRKSESRSKCIEMLLDFHYGCKKIAKKLSNSKGVYQKQLESSILILSNSILYEGYDPSAFFGVIIDDNDFDMGMYYKALQNQSVNALIHQKFISYCALTYDDIQATFPERVNELISQNENLSDDLVLTYALMSASIDIFKRFVASYGLDISDYLGDHVQSLEDLFYTYDSCDLHGYSLIFKRILQDMIFHGEADKKPVNSLGNEQEDLLILYYDDDYLYLIESDLRNKIVHHLPSHIKLNHILRHLKDIGLLVTYNSSDYFTVKISLQNSSKKRVTVIKIKNSLLDDSQNQLL